MLLVIVGPTGSGKTSLAIELANRFNAPIINADAFQIYDEMNIGTAKVPKNSLDYQKHYLLDVVKPSETYSVKQYQEDFRKVYEQLRKSYNTIIVCGGTGLYIKAALYDYNFEDETHNNDVSDLEKFDNKTLFNMLLEIDPEATKNIHPNNRKRVLRALQIARTHTLKKSEAIASQEHALYYKDEVVKFYFLNPEREPLYTNINARVDAMFANGLVDEVKNLLKKYQFSLTARAAIGYKEVIDFLAGECDYEQCVELIKRRTRNYAKRQVTFFKHQLSCLTFNSREQLLEEVLKNGE